MSEITKVRIQSYIVGILSLILGIWSIAQSLDFRELQERNANLSRKAEKLSLQLEARQMEIRALEELRTEELRIMSADENSKVNTLAVQNNNPCNIKAVRTPWKGQVGTDKHGHAVFDEPAHGIPCRGQRAHQLLPSTRSRHAQRASSAGSAPETVSNMWRICPVGSDYNPTRASMCSPGLPRALAGYGQVRVREGMGQILVPSILPDFDSLQQRSES